MRKTLTILGALALVLAITAGATAAGKAVFATGSVDSRVVKDGSLRLTDLTATSEEMIRDGWRLANGKTKVTEDLLDDSLKAKVDRPAYVAPTTLQSKVGFVAGVDNALTAGDRFGRSVDFPLPTPKPVTGADVVIVAAGAKSDFCPGTFADPKATAGKLCVYLGSSTDGTANANGFAVYPLAGLGFHFTWNAVAPGETRAIATYAYQAPAA